MTNWLSGEQVAQTIERGVPGAIEEVGAQCVWIYPERWHEVASLAKESAGLEMEFLNSVTGVDYIEYFEVVYHLTSLRHNHACVLKVRCWGREEPSLPSVVDLWRGADLQEREVYDLMGISFTGREGLKRVLLWEGYKGHPLRKDYLEEPLPYTWPQGG